ncbi:ribonuclease H-like protein [Rozella allomycis CSF55]|nr:ribonuclease H-like protein [Rozella allomycis CSF55]
MSYYAVAVGRNPGIYSNWCDCEKEVKGYPNAKFQKFRLKEQAAEFVNRHKPPEIICHKESTLEQRATVESSEEENFAIANRKTTEIYRKPEKEITCQNFHSKPVYELISRNNDSIEMPFYAVAIGKTPGIYRTWKDAEKEIKGFPNARFRKFKTLKEAEEFVNQNKKESMNTQEDLDPKLDILRVNMKPFRQAGDPNPQDRETLVCFTDGSAISNGSFYCKAGWAAVFPHNENWNTSAKLSGGKKTNNRAEYLAAIEAIKRANKEDPSQSKTLYIYTDSMLLIRSMTAWVTEWMKRDWKKADGLPVLNKDLLIELVQVIGKRIIIWQHVRSHTKKKNWESFWNDKADRMAQNAAR